MAQSENSTGESGSGSGSGSGRIALSELPLDLFIKQSSHNKLSSRPNTPSPIRNGSSSTSSSNSLNSNSRSSKNQRSEADGESSSRQGEMDGLRHGQGTAKDGKMTNDGHLPSNEETERRKRKQALLRDQDDEEEEKSELLKGRAGGEVGKAQVRQGKSRLDGPNPDSNSNAAVSIGNDLDSNDKSFANQDPDSTFTTDYLPASSSPNKSEGFKASQSSELTPGKGHSDFKIFEDSPEVTDLISRGEDPFRVERPNPKEDDADDQQEEIVDENKKPDWLIEIEIQDSKIKRDSKSTRRAMGKVEKDLNSTPTPTSLSSSPNKSSNTSSSLSSSSPNKKKKGTGGRLSLISDSSQLDQDEIKSESQSKVESKAGVAPKESSFESIIETRSQKKRKVTPKISVQTQ